MGVVQRMFRGVCFQFRRVPAYVEEDAVSAIISRIVIVIILQTELVEIPAVFDSIDIVIENALIFLKAGTTAARFSPTILERVVSSTGYSTKRMRGWRGGRRPRI